jgi:hypothetical protein
MSKETKETLVEWLNLRIKPLEFYVQTNQITWDEYFKRKDKLIIRAKEMEKEKQHYFFDCGRQYQLTNKGTFTQVYNKTYEEK